MKNVLVTGGSGFIGLNFILELLETNKDVNVLNFDVMTYASKYYHQNIKNMKKEDKGRYASVKSNICNKMIVKYALRKLEIDTIVHFAAESHVDRSINNPSIFIDTNIVGTFNLLEESRKYIEESKIKDFRFIHVSTDEVYGSLGKEGLFTEQTPYAPNSPYAASKASSDLLVRSYYHTYNFPAIITNCSNNYGPFQFPEKLIPVIITNILNKKPLPIYGEGKNIRDWLYVRDHCKAILTVLEKGRIGEQYNIGGNNEWANIDLVKLLCKKMRSHVDFDPETLIEFVTDRLGHDLRYAIDSSKIKNELGWEPIETFETGIDKTIEYYLNKGNHNV